MKIFNKRTVLRYLIIGIFLPLFVQYVIYFRFTSNYMLNVFSEKNFKAFYNNNVFRYRVLGKTVHLWVYNKLAGKAGAKKAKGNTIYDKRLTALDPQADSVFYFTYFAVAAVFTILSALALLYLFDSQQLFEMTELKKVVITSGVIFLTGFLEFVVTPYDNITYFFFIISSLLFLRFFQTKRLVYFILLNLTIILATLNHESSLLNLSFMAAIYFSCYGFDFRWIRIVIIPFFCYAFTWIGLRISINISGPGVVTEGLKLFRNLNILNASGVMGVIFPVIVFYFLFTIADQSNNKKLVRNFLLMASPYILMLPFIGIMVEARLWMPVIIGGVLISQLNGKALYITSLPKPENTGLFRTS